MLGTVADVVEGTGRRDPVAESLHGDVLEAAELNGFETAVAAARQDQRQGDGAIDQVGSASLARSLRWAGDVEDVVEQLEGETDVAAERGEVLRPRPSRGDPAKPAGGFEETRGLQRAALQVARLGDRGVEGVASLGELAESQRDRGRAELRDLGLP